MYQGAFDLCRRFFVKKRTGLRSIGISFLMAAVGFSIVTLLHRQTGIYFVSITISTAILISLYGNIGSSLVFTALIILLSDYFFIPPTGSILTDIRSLEHFLIGFTTGLIMSLLSSILQYSFHRTILAKQEAERATQTMEKILALVSHDIRNPLLACRISADLMLHTNDKSERIRNLATRIIAGLDRTDSMIQTLLDVSRIRAGNVITLEFEFCDLTAIVCTTIDELSTVYRNRFYFEKPKPILALWSPQGIRRALENMMTNAIKYGSIDTPIVIQLTQKSETIFLSVHNKGKEIKKADQAKLFDPYFRTRSAEDGKHLGWGLGLELVKGIAEAHGGRVFVESSKTLGTTFSLRLPIKVSSNHNEGQTQKAV